MYSHLPYFLYITLLLRRRGVLWWRLLLEVRNPESSAYGKMVYFPLLSPSWICNKFFVIRPLVTVSTAVMRVVHFAKVSTLYLWVVISSLAKRLEKPPFCHSYTSFGAWPRDHYMSLQRFTMGHMLGLAKVSRGRPRRVTMPIAVPWPLLHRVSLVK
jgi:hypothetical protein